MFPSGLLSLLKFFIVSLILIIIFSLVKFPQKRSEFSTLKNLIICNDKRTDFSFEISGKFIVLNNIVKATKTFKCSESVTLTTPADYRFLDNIPPLVDVWRGPISVALYAPGSDFFDTIDSISYLRNCASNSSLIKELVTFHIFFESQHFPDQVEAKSLINFNADNFNCSSIPPLKFAENETMLYKMENKLLYPINKARNIARKNAQTYFVFPSDIELFPTPNFIEKFLHFANEFENIQDGTRRVFVLPIFEINAQETIPKNKTQLQQMFEKKVAFWFHRKLCNVCHRVIKGEEWIAANESGQEIGIFATGKRKDEFKFWEPFYVSNNEEPLFDERFTWEGQNNKIIQAFTMCILDYDFVILDNAFLVHKPGVKKSKEKQSVRFKAETKAASKLMRRVHKELFKLLGDTPECK